jgi:pilus assembly protein CpaE
MKDKINIFILGEDATEREDLRARLAVCERVVTIGGSDYLTLSADSELALKADAILLRLKDVDEVNTEQAMSFFQCLHDIPVVIVGDENTPKAYRYALQVGARDYLPYLVSTEILLDSLEQACRWNVNRHDRQLVLQRDAEKNEGQIFTVFSTKGGVGKSTVSVNLAVALTMLTSRRVALLDLDLQFGDVSIMLDMQPGKTLYDLVCEQAAGELDVKPYIKTHKSGVDVLSAPAKPEQAEVISGEHIQKILKTLKVDYDYVVVDTCQLLEERVLTALDMSDEILLLATLDLPTIKNAKLCLDVMRALSYEESRIKLVVNRSSRTIGISPKDFEESLGKEIDYHIPSDGTLVISSANSGVPFVLTAKSAKISKSVFAMAKDLTALEKKHVTDSSSGSGLIGSLKMLFAGKG